MSRSLASKLWHSLKPYVKDLPSREPPDNQRLKEDHQFNNKKVHVSAQITLRKSWLTRNKHKRSFTSFWWRSQKDIPNRILTTGNQSCSKTCPLMIDWHLQLFNTISFNLKVKQYRHRSRRRYAYQPTTSVFLAKLHTRIRMSVLHPSRSTQLAPAQSSNEVQASFK